jgi:hypothetical protein
MSCKDMEGSSYGLEELKKITKNLSQDSLFPGGDLNKGPPEYEAGVPTSCVLRWVLWQFT